MPNEFESMWTYFFYNAIEPATTFGAKFRGVLFDRFYYIKYCHLNDFLIQNEYNIVYLVERRIPITRMILVDHELSSCL